MKPNNEANCYARQDDVEHHHGYADDENGGEKEEEEDLKVSGGEWNWLAGRPVGCKLEPHTQLLACLTACSFRVYATTPLGLLACKQTGRLSIHLSIYLRLPGCHPPHPVATHPRSLPCLYDLASASQPTSLPEDADDHGDAQNWSSNEIIRSPWSGGLDTHTHTGQYLA